MSVSIVMPSYNEEEIIEKVIRNYYDEIILKIDDSEFIAVDDCSKDSTYNILTNLQTQLPKLKVLRTPVNSGHGKAIRMAYEIAKGDYVFQIDSDNQFVSKDFWKLYPLRVNYDFVLGFRKTRRDPMVRLFLSRVIRIVNFILFGVWIKDVNCPFRLIKKMVLEQLLIFIDTEALTPNIMLSILAKTKRIKMIEIPIIHYARKTGVVSLIDWKLIKFVLRGFKQLLILKKSLIA